MLTLNQIDSDNRKMKRFIGERIPPDGTRIVLVDGTDGPAWVDLIPLWDEEGECDLVLNTNEPDAFGLRDVYDHLRRKELTGREWERELIADVNRSKIRKLERENVEMRGKLNQRSGPENDEAISDEEELPKELSTTERIEVALAGLTTRFAAIENNIAVLAQRQTVKEFYTTQDLCKMFGKAPYTVREWCRLGRIKAKKIRASCGGECEWRIPHEELVRLQNDGLLPIPAKY